MSRDTSKFFHSRRVERGRLGRLLDYKVNRGRVLFLYCFPEFCWCVFRSVMYEFYKQSHRGSGLRLH